MSGLGKTISRDEIYIMYLPVVLVFFCDWIEKLFFFSSLSSNTWCKKENKLMYTSLVLSYCISMIVHCHTIIFCSKFAVQVC